MAPADPKKLFDPKLNKNKSEFDRSIFFVPPPRWGGMVLATSKKTKDRELPLGAYPP